MLPYMAAVRYQDRVFSEEVGRRFISNVIRSGKFEG